jgi:hypothetical protein
MEGLAQEAGMLSWTRVGMIVGWAALSLSSQVAQAQNKLTAGSSWVNELGSVLTINNVASNGLMTGTYVTKVGCDAGLPQPMTGWYYSGNTGGAITFTVNWQSCNSLTSWTGQYNYSNNNFQTLWYLAAAAAPAWNGINAGTDTFVPQNAVMTK